MSSKLFKIFNSFVAIFCIGIIYANHVGVNVLSTDKATSSVGNNNFEYKSEENSLSFIKDGKLIGHLPTERKISFSSKGPILKCNATVIAAKKAITYAKAARGDTVIDDTTPDDIEKIIIGDAIPDDIAADNTKVLNNVLAATGAAATGSFLGAVLPGAVLKAIGFGSSGIIKGSVAAAIQSSIGNVVGGSLFSHLTAAGFIGVAPIGGILTGGGIGLGLA